MIKNHLCLAFCLLLMALLLSCARRINVNKTDPTANAGLPVSKDSVVSVGGDAETKSLENENTSSKKDKFDISTYSGQVYKDITYATGLKTYQGTVEDMKLDIYMPENQVDGKKYPLIVFAHGGGLLVGDKSASSGYCAGYASNGFVTATINYRLGWEKDRTVLCSGDSMQMKQALYRALQDTRAALRFLVHNADQYAIDTNWVFLTGPSAGGAITLHTIYLTQEDADRFLPNVANILGSLDNSGNDHKETFIIKACANLWGGIGDLNLVTKANAVPCINFHGVLDKVSPYDYGNMYKCNLYMSIYGSKAIYEKLKSLNVPTVAHIDPNGGHGVYGQNFIINNTVCFFNNCMQQKKILSKYLTEQKSSCD